MNIDGEVNVIADTVPGQLLMLPDQVMAHVGHQQNSPLMEAPFADFSAECFIAGTHTTAHKVGVTTTCTAADHTLYRQVHGLCLVKLTTWQSSASIGSKMTDKHKQQHDSIAQRDAVVQQNGRVKTAYPPSVDWKNSLLNMSMEPATTALALLRACSATRQHQQAVCQRAW